MDSRQSAGGGRARLSEISRRGLLGGTPVAALAGRAAPFGTAKQGEGDRQLKRWLALDDRIGRLQARWARLEGWLVREHAWFELSPTERQALPWALELRDITGCLDVLCEQRADVLAALPSCGSVSLESIIARLTVVERLIWPGDHPEAHALVTGARQDLIAVSARGGAV